MLRDIVFTFPLTLRGGFLALTLRSLRILCVRCGEVFTHLKMLTSREVLPQRTQRIRKDRDDRIRVI